jgi:hypothetical protein
LGGGSGTDDSSELDGCTFLGGTNFVVVGSVVDGSGRLVGAVSLVVTGVSIGAITTAVLVVVTTAGGMVDGVSEGAGRLAIDGIMDVVVTDVVVAAGGTGPESSAGTTRNAAGAPRAAAPPTPIRMSAAPRPTRLNRRLDVVFPRRAAT